VRKTALGLIAHVPARRADLARILGGLGYDVAPIASADLAQLAPGLAAVICDARDPGAVADARALRAEPATEHLAFVALDGSPPGWPDAAVPSGGELGPAIERAIRSRRATAAMPAAILPARDRDE
jgi:hypothetical protein